MGNFHCISSSCAEVHYTPYVKKSGIRYRYPGEEWVIVEGADNWSIGADRYSEGYIELKFDVDLVVYETYRDPDKEKKFLDQLTVNRGVRLYGYAQSLLPVTNYHSMYLLGSHLVTSTLGVNTIISVSGSTDILQTTRAPQSTNRAYGYLPSTARNFSYVNKLKDDEVQYVFTVFKDGQKIEEITDIQFPEVEDLNSECELSDRTQVIRIEKSPFFDRVEVVDYFYDVRYGLTTDSDNYGLLLNKGKIPENCLNIYNNPTSTLPPEAIITNTPESGFRFVAQICSDEGCPRPKYEVICDCQKQCPDGTCDVLCGGHICCVDPVTGISVDEISVSEYLPTGFNDSSGAR